MKRFSVVLVVIVLTVAAAAFATTAYGCGYADPSGCHTSGAPVTGG